MVKAMLAWPSRSLTTLTGTPSLMSRVPWVWRRSCSRMTRDAGVGGDPLERLGDGVGVDGLAVAVGEHPAVVVDADGGELGGLQGLPAGEHGDGGGVEVDAAPGVARSCRGSGGARSRRRRARG